MNSIVTEAMKLSHLLCPFHGTRRLPNTPNLGIFVRKARREAQAQLAGRTCASETESDVELSRVPRRDAVPAVSLVFLSDFR